MPLPGQMLSYNGTSFLLSSGIFLCSSTAGTLANGIMLQYGQSLRVGVVSDTTPVLFLGRTKAAVEIGQARFNAASFTYTLPPQILKYDNTLVSAYTAKTALLGIDQDQHNGALCNYYDAEGNAWPGALFVTQESFDKLVGGGLGVTATWMEVG